jgi:hypothetical protein
MPSWANKAQFQSTIPLDLTLSLHSLTSGGAFF